MSTNSNRPLPRELRDQLDQETPSQRREIDRMWHLLPQRHPAAADAPDTEEAWHALQERLAAGTDTRNGEARPPSSPRPPAARNGRRYRPGRWLAVAAVLLSLVLGSAWLWLQPVRIAAAPGETATHVLPDGSVVELNSGTTLSFQRGFEVLPFIPARHRTVALQGEAFFEVKAGTRPFVVETFNARIEVLGTRFNVRARPDAASGETQVTLTAGRVQLAAHALGEPSVMLRVPGQTARVTGHRAAPTPPQAARTERVLAWRKRGFAASNQPLTAILAELEHRYAVHILTDEDAQAALDDSMTVFYPNPVGVETILHDLCVARGLHYRPTSRGYEIFRSGSAR